MKKIFRSAKAAIGAGVAIAALCAVQVEAGPVKYYSRSVLTNLKTAPTYTYTPAYGSYGACSAGTQSASMTSCTRSDGTVVANSYCSPATKSQSCTMPTVSCSITPFTSGSGRFKIGSGGTVQNLGTFSNTTQAVALCNNYITSNSITTPSVCYITVSKDIAYLYVGGTIVTSASSVDYASACN